MELTEDYEVLLRFMEYRDEIFDDEPGSTKRDDEVPQNLNEDVPPAPIGLQIFPFLESRTGKYAARIEYRAAVVPGVKEYRIAVLYRIQNYAGDFQRSSMDAFSNHTSCLFRGGDDGEGLIPGLTYEVALAPISPTTGLHFGGFSDRVARTVQTIPKAYWTLAGSLAQQIVIRT